MRVIPLLSLVILSLLGHRHVQAAARFGPVLTYESFKRSIPENADVVRWGGGLRFTVDVVYPKIALELEGLYTKEDDTFSTTNTFTEQVYRGRAGLLLRLVNAGPLHLGLRGGAQYALTHDEYFVRSTNQLEKKDYRHLTPYGGAEISLLPLSGFGIHAGATFSRDKILGKWVPQFSFGLVLR